MPAPADDGGVSSIDALPPPEIARKAEDVGVTKAALERPTTFALAVLAGAFIALGAAFATTTLAGSSGLPYGVARLLAGLTFSLGLILVVVAGAELFTGNNLIVMAWASRQGLDRAPRAQLGDRLRRELRRRDRHRRTDARGRAAGLRSRRGRETAVAIATTKVGYGFGQAVALGMLCNALVCLAVWLCYGARSTGDKILAIVPPIAAFVACGFEHSVANMYFVPFGIFAGADISVG